MVKAKNMRPTRKGDSHFAAKRRSFVGLTFKHLLQALRMLFGSEIVNYQAVSDVGNALLNRNQDPSKSWRVGVRGTGR